MYNEKDIHSILKRAIQLQGDKERFNGTVEELSLKEIEEIARDSGVSPEFVRQAVLEYDGVPVEEPLLIDSGSKRKVEILGFAKGDISKKSWTELVAEIEKQLKSKGDVKRRPGRLTWIENIGQLKRFTPNSAPARIDVSLKTGQRSIRMQKKLPAQFGLRGTSIICFGFAAFLLFMILTGQTSNSAIPPFILFSMLLSLTGFGTWKLADRLREGKKQRYKDLVESLQTIITRNHQASGKILSTEKFIDLGEDDLETVESKINRTKQKS